MRIRIVFYDDDDDDDEDNDASVHLIDPFSSFTFFTAYRGREQRTMVAEKKLRTPLSIMACVESGRKGSSFIERGILEAPGLDV